jgi:hypothetical protein
MAKIKFSNGTIVDFNGDPTPEDIEEVAFKLGITKESQPEVKKPEPKKTPLQKTANAVDTVMGPVSNFMFGSTGKAVGGLITRGIGGAKSLIGQATGNAEMKKEGDRLQKVAIPTKTDIAFTFLETYPGGGQISKYLKKLPGGEKIAETIKNGLNKAPEGLREKALEQYASIFNATSQKSKDLVKKVAEPLLKSKEVITSVPKLIDKAKTLSGEAGSGIKKFVSALPDEATATLKPSIDKLEDMKGKYLVAGKVVDQAKINAVEKTQEMLAQFGDVVRAKDTIAIRRILDESVDEAGGFIADKAAKFTAKVEKTASDAIRNELAKDYPDLAKLNKQFNFWDNVKKLAAYTDGKKPTILRRTLAGTVGGIVGASSNEGTGGKIQGAVFGAVIGDRAIAFIKSPAWKSVSAIAKNQIADRLAIGDAKKAAELIKRAMIGLTNLKSGKDNR